MSKANNSTCPCGSACAQKNSRVQQDPARDASARGCACGAACLCGADCNCGR